MDKVDTLELLIKSYNEGYNSGRKGMLMGTLSMKDVDIDEFMRGYRAAYSSKSGSGSKMLR